MKKVTAEQIKQWKAAHGNVFLLEVGDKSAYVRSPNRRDISAVNTISAGDDIVMNELLLEYCWLEGDEEIKTDDRYFLGVLPKMNKIVEAEDASIKKL